MKRILRLIFLVLVIAVGPAAIFWIRSQGITALNWLYLPLLVLWAALGGLWYLFFGKATVGKRFLRFGLAVLAFVALAGIGKSLLRYEGSASGSSFPRFSWAWEKPGEATPVSPEVVRTELASQTDRLREAAGDVVDFLGPGRDGMWESLPFDPDWTAPPPELLWKRPLGKAWSSFVASGGRAVTQEQVDDSERVTCLDLFTGDELWHHDDKGVRLLLVKAENSGAAMGGDGPRSTPVIHGGKVITAGATGVVNCLDLESGELLWTRNVIGEFGGETQRWGIANSPLVLEEEGLAVVAGSDRMGGGPGVTLVALSLETGVESWVYEGTGASYSSARLLEFGGVEQIVSVNAGEVTGISPADGRVLWRHEWKGAFPKVAQPLQVGPDKLLITASYGVGSHLLRIANDSGNWSVEKLWSSNRLKTKFSSAAIVGDLAVGLDEGRIAAVRLEDGKIAWKGEKYGFGQNLLFGDHLLIQAESGAVVVGIPGAEGFEEVSRLEALDSMTWNAPAVAGRLLLVRNDREAACYLLPEKR